MQLNKRRSGFTLVELLAVLALSAVVCGAAVGVLRRQQRFFTALSAAVGTREQLRDGAQILAAELRGASTSPAASLLADSAVELFTTIGGSITCDSATGSTITLAPVAVGNPMSLAWFAVPPDTGDVAIIYGTNATDTAGMPGSWQTHRIASVSRSSAAVCNDTWSSNSSVAGSTGTYVLALRDLPATQFSGGAPVRFLRRSRFSLYQSGDGRWYLGYRRCNAAGSAACGPIQPLSGPYDPYVPGRSGMTLRYYDATGVELDYGWSGASLARIDVVMRASEPRAAAFSAEGATPFRDSIAFSVALRNAVP